MMTIVLGADHRGFAQKNLILTQFKESDYELIDVGTDTAERTDYPLYTHKAIELMQHGTAQLGILLCGSGIGMAMAANRYQGIYAGVAWNVHVAQQAKQDDNVNVLVLPSDYIADDQIMPIIDAWLHAAFKGGRYQERLVMID